MSISKAAVVLVHGGWHNHSTWGPGLFVGNPAATGATRINVGSAADTYRSRLKATFYGDVSESDFTLAASLRQGSIHEHR
jgi:hypothetical protein